MARNETAEPVSRDQILRRDRGQGNINFPSSAGQEKVHTNNLTGIIVANKHTHTHTHTFQRSLLEWKQNNLRFRIIVESHTVYDVACATCGIRGCMLFWTRACLALSSTLQWSLLEILCIQLALCPWNLLIGDKRHRYTFGSPDKLGTNPMVVAKEGGRRQAW